MSISFWVLLEDKVGFNCMWWAEESALSCCVYTCEVLPDTATLLGITVLCWPCSLIAGWVKRSWRIQVLVSGGVSVCCCGWKKQNFSRDIPTVADHYREQHFPCDFIVILKTTGIYLHLCRIQCLHLSLISVHLPYLCRALSFLICGLYEMTFLIQIGNGARKADHHSHCPSFVMPEVTGEKGTSVPSCNQESRK